MTLREIAEKAKDGDRFQNSPMRERGNKNYYFMRGDEIHIHFMSGKEQRAELNCKSQFTDNYEFLPLSHVNPKALCRAFLKWAKERQ